MRTPFKRCEAYLLAGPYFVQCGFRDGKFAFWDLATGELAGVGALPVNPPDGAPAAQKRAYEGSSAWRWLGAATPFAHGGRFYVRANDFLWCFEAGTEE
jgi:hypothetical protein